VIDAHQILHWEHRALVVTGLHSNAGEPWRSSGQENSRSIVNAWTIHALSHSDRLSVVGSVRVVTAAH